MLINAIAALICNYNISYNVSRVCENTAKFGAEYHRKKKAATSLETQKTPPI